jgi:hypothetical protein
MYESMNLEDNLSILDLQILDRIHDDVLSSFQDFSSYDNFIQDAIDFMKVENDI